MGATITAPRSARRERTGLRWGRLLRVLAIVVPALLVLAYAGISIYVAGQLSSPPRRVVATDPGRYGMTYENVSFNSTVDNVPLSGWFIDSPGTTAVIMLHGRAAARDDEPAMEVAAALVGRGYDVLMFDFRAHGTSGGDRYSLGQRETRDVAGAVNYLKGRGTTKMAAYGISMGAATLLRAAGDLPEIKTIVVDSPFADLSMLLGSEFPKLSGLPNFFLPGVIVAANLVFGIDLQGNKPFEFMPALNDRPIFLIHTEGDGTIPVQHAYMLQKAGAGNARMQVWIAPGVGHTTAFKNHPDEYLSKVLAFYDLNMQ